MKILHLIPADGKTPQLIAARFAEVETIRSRYLVYASEKSSGNLPADSSAAGAIEFVSLRYLLSAKCRAEVARCDALMIHFMTPWAAYVALHARKDLPVIWCGWGGDYQRHITASIGELVLAGTASLQTSAGASSRGTFSIFRLLRQLAKKMVLSVLFYRWESRILSRVNYFSAPIPDDFELIKRSCPTFKAKYYQISYGSVGTLFRNENVQTNRDNILIGNSATATNNHVEIFQHLQRLNLGDRKLIVPLNYGDTAYCGEVIKIGRAMFGGNFCPLTEFLPLADYHHLISSCGVVIMNHKRQQALGNINTMLYQGARVFLNPDSVVYSFFIKRGACVFQIGDISRMAERIFQPLTEEQIQKNRSVLDGFWGHEVVINNIRQLEKAITEHE